jgi:hypothetical protein
MDPKNLVRAIEAGGITLWSWNVDTDALAMDDHAYDLGALIEALMSVSEDCTIHPADQDRVRAVFNATRGITGAFEIDFHTDQWRVEMASARGQG